MPASWLRATCGKSAMSAMVVRSPSTQSKPRSWRSASGDPQDRAAPAVRACAGQARSPGSPSSEVSRAWLSAVISVPAKSSHFARWCRPACVVLVREVEEDRLRIAQDHGHHPPAPEACRAGLMPAEGFALVLAAGEEVDGLRCVGNAEQAQHQPDFVAAVGEHIVVELRQGRQPVGSRFGAEASAPSP